MGELEWTNDLAIRLIQEYEKRPELWDMRHEMYRVQTLKYETWSELARMFDCDIADLRKKLNSLFASHRREKAKVRAGGRSTWFLYPYMSFLPSHIGNDSGEAVVYFSVIGFHLYSIRYHLSVRLIQYSTRYIHMYHVPAH